MSTVPTLLVGLGGIGSRVVDQVYGWIPPDRRDRIAIHAFDTNVNDIKKLKNIQGKVTQTSHDWTVGQYLYKADPSVREWFPHEIRLLHRKIMTEGAGQIRVVSRLAYRAAIETGKLSGLESQIAGMFRATGDSLIQSVRVMIVSSMAGGTGSGIFLQTAMYIRELLERVYGRQNVLVRGAFLLPDTLILTKLLDPEEWDEVRANGYASVKELDAITTNASGTDKNLSTIELEYRPNQTDSSGRPSFAITERHLPYDFVFFYDYENTAGENLGGFGNYINQVSKSIYLRLFSPMSNDLFSEEDNKIRNLVNTQGRSRYGGAGVASVIYPYRDIVEYCALRWAADSLSDQWLRIDREYLDELKQYEFDLHSGVQREKPALNDSYVRLFDLYGTEESPQSFFKKAYRSTRLIGEQGKLLAPKADQFLDAVDREIERVLQGDLALKQAEADCEVDPGRLRDKRNAEQEVVRVEEALLSFKQQVDTAVTEHRNYLVNQIVARDCQSPASVEGQEHRLNTWVLMKPEALHPVAVRYFLYQVQIRLADSIQTLSNDNEKLRQGIERYALIYDLDDTEAVETAEDRIAMALRQPFFKALFDNQFKVFVETYEDRARGQRRSLMLFKSERLKELVYQGVLRAIGEMLEEWERYFRGLRDTRNNLLNELNRKAVEHEQTADPTRIFVLGDKKWKERLWEERRLTVMDDDLPKGISSQIYIGQYRRYCLKKEGEFLAEQKPEKVEEMFRKDVLGWCRNELSKDDDLNVNVVRALARESRYLGGEEPDPHIESVIQQLSRLARPLVPRVENTSQIDSWGAHEETMADLSERQKESLFGNDLVQDAAFSPYEIICYRSQYGMLASGFPKFSSGEPEWGMGRGLYFSAYEDRKKLLDYESNAVTPHLDKRWHKEAYLPDLNPRQVVVIEERIDRALLLGLTMGYLRVVVEDERRVWEFFGPGGSRLVSFGGRNTPGEICSLHEALRHNTAIVDQILDLFTAHREEDVRKHGTDISLHRFLKGCEKAPYDPDASNIVETILRYSCGAPHDAALPARGDRLISQTLKEVGSYYLFFYGGPEGPRDTQARREAAEMIRKLVQSSPAYTTADAQSSRYLEWQHLIERALAQLGPEQ